MIAVSAGHNPGRQGACDGDFCEHGEAVIWADIIVRLIHQFGGQAVYVPTGTLGSKVRWINDNDVDIAVEIHFNSDPTHSGKGSETLYCPGSIKGKHLAAMVHASYSVIVPPGRGFKPGWYRMDTPGVKDYAGDVEGDEKPDYFLKQTSCPAIIVEPEFIHNKRVIEDKRLGACAMIAIGLVKAEPLCS